MNSILGNGCSHFMHSYVCISLLQHVCRPRIHTIGWKEGATEYLIWWQSQKLKLVLRKVALNPMMQMKIRNVNHAKDARVKAWLTLRSSTSLHFTSSVTKSHSQQKKQSINSLSELHSCGTHVYCYLCLFCKLLLVFTWSKAKCKVPYSC